MIPFDPEREERRRKAVLGVWAAIAIVAVSVLMLTLRPDLAPDPDDAVTSFYAAAAAGDLDAGAGHLCRALVSQGRPGVLPRDLEPGARVRVTDVDESGDTAVVKADLIVTHGESTRSSETAFEVVREDGHWRICGRRQG